MKVTNTVVDIDWEGSEAILGMVHQFEFISITNQCFVFGLQIDLQFPQSLNNDQESAHRKTSFAHLTSTH